MFAVETKAIVLLWVVCLHVDAVSGSCVDLDVNGCQTNPHICDDDLLARVTCPVTCKRCPNDQQTTRATRAGTTVSPTVSGLGPLCYQCSQHDKHDGECLHLQQCNQGEVCAVFKDTIGFFHKCMGTMDCVYTELTASNECFYCCRGDGCNQVCPQSSYIPTTTPTPATTTAPCVDTEPNCLFLNDSFNFCADIQKARQHCQRFCSLCLAATGDTTSQIPATTATSLPLLQTVGALDCLNCSGVLSPEDCNRRVTCTADEICNIEQYVTSGGYIRYNVGCRSKQLCGSVGKRSTQKSIAQRFIATISSSLRFFTRNEDDDTYDAVADVTANDQSDSQDIIVCSECCADQSYCNRNGCGNVARNHPDQQYCALCDNALSADQCETITLCNRHELCYVETINLNGDPRYRLGCIPQDKCSHANSTSSSASTPGVPSLVGKRQLLPYCAKCCSNTEGVCNSHLCSSSQTVPAGTILKELVDPPQRNDSCTDFLESACPPLILNDYKLCLEPMYKNFACRKTCGSCHTTATTTQTPATITVPSPSSLPASDCYYRSEAYMGRYDTTVTQQPCVRWDAVSVLQGQNLSFPDGGIDSADSFCRDPNKSELFNNFKPNKILGHPWCFVSSTTFEWQYCPVPLCQECYHSNRSYAFDGFTDTTADGNQCMLWTDAAKIAPPTLPVGAVFFPSKSVTAAGNKCRDPYRSGQQQCYASDVLKNCSVPACVVGCTDKGTLNCAGLKAFVCQSEYLSITQCAKTCGKCSFGVLPSKLVDFGIGCVDADPNCDILSNFICKDLESATRICPKTCHVCDKLLPLGGGITTPKQVVATTTTSTQSPTTIKPHWLGWSELSCSYSHGICFFTRNRTCTSEYINDCAGSSYDLRPGCTNCTESACHDDPNSNCTIKESLNLICGLEALAAKVCPKSCGLCGTCYDLLDCSSTAARHFFCSNDKDAVRYCRKTCGKCGEPQVAPNLNMCGDPVNAISNCETLEWELCICKDDSIKSLCHGYCSDTCTGYSRNKTINQNCHVIPDANEQRLQRHALHPWIARIWAAQALHPPVLMDNANVPPVLMGNFSVELAQDTVDAYLVLEFDCIYCNVVAVCMSGKGQCGTGVDPTCTRDDQCTGLVCHQSKHACINNKCVCSDYCHPNPCNKGTCRLYHTSHWTSFKCTCPPGINGTTCDEDPCHPDPCSSPIGTCENTQTAPYFNCRCRYGFTGDKCEENHHCEKSPCMHNGSCITRHSYPFYYCQCHQPYYGGRCERENFCHSNPCHHYGATCTNGYHNYTCVCHTEACRTAMALDGILYSPHHVRKWRYVCGFDNPSDYLYVSMRAWLHWGSL
ncbi:uncharacterized protein LOC128221770 [Mya arenaria]|uniref:uncharacterized protein LOC128221770 n=1 Tax=Mya arenaria TaxID=6604 RepID=UPI0022E790BB|nr:uncharacterized protein LOC128221770 [Mya arenaria]